MIQLSMICLVKQMLSLQTISYDRCPTSKIFANPSFQKNITYSIFKNKITCKTILFKVKVQCMYMLKVYSMSMRHKQNKNVFNST